MREILFIMYIFLSFSLQVIPAMHKIMHIYAVVTFS